MDLTDCPMCGATAQVRDRYDREGTDGAVPHMKTLCIHGHVYDGPVEEAVTG
jgi:hypothetical protein